MGTILSRLVRVNAGKLFFLRNKFHYQFWVKWIRCNLFPNDHWLMSFVCLWYYRGFLKKVKICVSQWQEIVRSLGIKWMQNGHWVNLKPKDSVNLVEVVWAHLDATIEMIWLNTGQPILISYFKNSWICQALFRTCKH